MPPAKQDYTLYSVTDTSQLPPGRSLAQQVREAIAGGCTIVQLREKKLPTRDLVTLAREIHKVTQEHNVPLLINDRIDVALAVDCEGAHIGWDDLDYVSARRLLGPNKIIGISVSNHEQAAAAVALQPDYLGIGPVFATATKPDHNPPMGVRGLRDLLSYVHSLGEWGAIVPTVAIGFVNLGNIQNILRQSASSKKSLSGVAVVAAIMSSPEPAAVCRSFRNAFTEQLPFKQPQMPIDARSFDEIWARARETKPMVHHITNNVVKPFSANLCLAAGGSPIMSENIEEFAELAAFNGALIINMGTAGSSARPMFAKAITENNKHGNPVIFDPVGAGASALRRETVRSVLEAGYSDVIKGNESEIRTVAGESVQQRGVDSSSTGDSKEATSVVKALAAREDAIVVMTGKTDIVSDGRDTFLLKNGHEYQGIVTGTGCSLGSVIGVAMAANRDTKLQAVLTAITTYNIAAEMAAEGADGPGSWAARFVDAVGKMTKGDGKTEWRTIKIDPSF